MAHRFWRGPESDSVGESQTAARQERRVLVRRALASSDVDEHLEIGVQNQQRRVGIAREVSLHEDETRTSRHRPTAIRQDGDRLIVLPVVNDVAQDVGVAAGGHRVEEAPSDELAAVDDADLLDDLPSVLDDVRLVEEDAAQAEEHTSELQSRSDLVCRLLLEKKKKHRAPVLRPQTNKKTDS